MRRLTALPTGVLLAGLIVVSALLRFEAGSRVPTPWINPDEIIYAELARSLYLQGTFEILGEPAEFLSLAYPALIGPLLAFVDLETGYYWTKLLQAVVMSLAAVPAYLWARTVASRGWSLVAAVLTLAIPGLAYSGLLMTEVAFYPVTLLAAYLMARTLVRPTLPAQILLVGAVALAAMTRLQAFVLVPVFVTALAGFLLLERRPGDVRRYVPAVSGLVLLCLAWAVWRLRDGGPLSRLFGGYEPAGQADYGLGDAARFTVYHLGDVVILSGLFPACALGLLWAARGHSPALRAYLAVATALVLWLVLEVGVFASGLVGYLAERNILPLAPVLFVGFAAWLDRGGPRPRAATAVVAVLVVGLLVVLPAGELIAPVGFPNSFTIQPLIELKREVPDVDLDLLVACLAAAGVLLLAFVRPRSLWVLPALLAAVFAATSVVASREVIRQAEFVQVDSVGPDPRWIDRRVDGPTAYVYIGELNWIAVWENAFWNQRLDHAYGLLTARVLGGLPHVSVGPRENGRLVTAGGEPVDAEYAVAQYPLTFAGEAIATGGQGLVLWKLDQPFRLSVWTQRVAGHVRVLVYGCPPGELRLELQAPGRRRVELRRNGSLYLRVALTPAGRWSGAIPAQVPGAPGTGVCTFDVLGPEDVLAPTVQFVPGGTPAAG